MSDDAKIPTSKKLRAALKKLKPEQLSILKFRISDVFAQHKHAQFKLIRGSPARSLKACKPCPCAIVFS